MILILAAIRRLTDFEIEDRVIGKLGLVITVAAQITLVMLASELFVEFYRHTHHSLSATCLFFGLKGKHALVPWIWTSIGLNVLATGFIPEPWGKIREYSPSWWSSWSRSASWRSAHSCSRFWPR